jgi:hypothetical protein
MSSARLVFIGTLGISFFKDDCGITFVRYMHHGRTLTGQWWSMGGVCPPWYKNPIEQKPDNAYTGSVMRAQACGDNGPKTIFA